MTDFTKQIDDAITLDNKAFVKYNNDKLKKI